MATANAVTFDGTNDYLSEGDELTGQADSQIITFAFFFRRGALGGTQKVFWGGGNDFAIEFQTTNVLRIFASDVGDHEDLDFSSSAITDTASWHSALGSFDASDTTNRKHLYIDDSSDLNETNFVNDTFDWTKADYGVGATSTGGNKYTGDLALFWLDFSQYIDFSVEANRRIFITSGNLATSQYGNSTTGSFGGLSQPQVFFNNVAASWQTNLGAGNQGFDLNGTLDATTGPEIGGLNVLRRRREIVGAF